MAQIFLPLIGLLIIFSLLYFLVFQARRSGRFSPFTENMLRSPAYTLRKELDDLYVDIIVPIMFLILVPILMFRQVVETSNLLLRLILLMIVFLVMFFAIKKTISVWRKAQRLRLGFDGEVYTGQELNYLMREGAWVYHDIPYKYGNIDHVIISKGGILTVETKTIRKPQNSKGKRDFKVSLNQEGQLVFPHVQTSKPVEQAKRHADYLKKRLFELTGNEYPVTPVVALPGWYVSNESKPSSSSVWVINPQRGKALAKKVRGEVIVLKDMEVAVARIEDIARSVSSNTDLTDPDAKKKFNFIFSRKSMGREL